MDIKQVTPFLAVAPALRSQDLAAIAAAGYQAVINNRPDGEVEDQASSAELQAAAESHGLLYRHLPVVSGKVTDKDVEDFRALLDSLPGPVLAFCRTGTRSISLWALAEARHLRVDRILSTTASLGYDLQNLAGRLEAVHGQAQSGASAQSAQRTIAHTYDVVIVGGGAGGIAAASSLLRRRDDLEIVIVEPNTNHYYQPGWTLVGAGVFTSAETERALADVLPRQVQWLHSAVAGFEPADNRLVLEDGERVRYRALVVAPGLCLNWHAIEGLSDTLGANGVTSNYLYNTAPYTWELVQGLQEGRAVFTQPPMPIKCAGAPQKSLYLSCDYWQRQSRILNIDVQFYNAGAVLFGVDAYVPALMEYVRRYDAHLNFQHNLVAVDGPGRRAWFDVVTDGQPVSQVEVGFDLLHVAPPQGPHGFLLDSPISDPQGWVAVDQNTLQQNDYDNIFALGDACSAPNAKTAAAVRKQAPVVAENVIAVLDGRSPTHTYDGYGSCPLTVERGKVVLAEFGYNGVLLPTFPEWLLDGTKPSRLAWFFKERMLPPIYWQLMLRGREWLAKPQAIAR